MNNYFGDIEMEQELVVEKIKLKKIGDEKHWPKYFGDFKNVTKYSGDIAKVAKKMVLGQMTDEKMIVTK